MQQNLIGESAANLERAITLRRLEAWLRTPMLVLSLLWLGIVVVELVWGTVPLIEIVVIVIWVLFALEFALRFGLAPEKKQFLIDNWLAAIALLLPAIRLLAAFRFLRLLRAARGLRLVRIISTANRSMNALRRTMRRRGFGYVVLLTIAVVFLGAAGMLALEPASQVEGGFSSYGDALWWTAMLLTTMGTDFWPQTAEGRLLCLLLAIYGFGVFGYITATLAAFFVGQEGRKEVSAPEFENLRQEIATLRHSRRGSRE